MKVRDAVLVFVSLFVPFAYFNHSDGWNQGARLSELHALVLKGTLSIDAYHEMTGDKALIDGHYYSEKAPGIVLVAMPTFSATVAAQQLVGIDPDSPEGWRAVSVGGDGRFRWRTRRAWRRRVLRVARRRGWACPSRSPRPTGSFSAR